MKEWNKPLNILSLDNWTSPLVCALSSTSSRQSTAFLVQDDFFIQGWWSVPHAISWNCCAWYHRPIFWWESCKSLATLHRSVNTRWNQMIRSRKYFISCLWSVNHWYLCLVLLVERGKFSWKPTKRDQLSFKSRSLQSVKPLTQRN